MIASRRWQMSPQIERVMRLATLCKKNSPAAAKA
jgi:hypothetical protein